MLPKNNIFSLTVSSSQGLILVGSFIFGALALLLFHSAFIKTDLLPNQWGLAFINPSDTNLTFEIQNENASELFHWTLLQKNKEMIGEDVQVSAETNYIVDPLQKTNQGNLSGKVQVRVTDSSGQSREIYKVLP